MIYSTTQQKENTIKPNSLLHYKGFEACFCQMLAIPARTYEDAYLMVEAIHEREFGFRKYSSYDSFRRVRFRHRKTKKV